MLKQFTTMPYGPPSTKAGLRPKYNVSVIKLGRRIPMPEEGLDGYERAFISPLDISTSAYISAT
jgi:hypothetical protein